MTETTEELCHQYEKSAASAPTELNDRPYQKLLTDPEGLEQLRHYSWQPREYLLSFTDYGSIDTIHFVLIVCIALVHTPWNY